MRAQSISAIYVVARAYTLFAIPRARNMELSKCTNWCLLMLLLCAIIADSSLAGEFGNKSRLARTCLERVSLLRLICLSFSLSLSLLFIREIQFYTVVNYRCARINYYYVTRSREASQHNFYSFQREENNARSCYALRAS